MSDPIRTIAGAALAALLAFPGPSAARTSAPDPAELCRRAADAAASRWNVPADVLHAISLTETGRRADGGFSPWPWTVNMEGRGMWFATADEALAYIGAHLRRGARSFDVGCFQINHRWHGAAFRSIAAMFDPAANADYAARFLSELHAEFGDWGRAAGAYHSRTPQLARKYRARFERILAGLSSEPVRAAPEPRTAPVAENAFPLLHAGAPISAGSLVPLSGRQAAGRLVPSG